MKAFQIILIFLFTCTQGFSQAKLRLTYERFGKLKTYELYKGDLLDYKLKGKLFFKKRRIDAFTDSAIVLRIDSVIKPSQIRSLRLVSSSHLAKTMQDAFIMAGGGFIFLNTVNNAIYERYPLIDPAAVYISAGLVGAGLIVKALRTKHIRIGKNKTLKIISADFENLNAGSNGVKSD